MPRSRRKRGDLHGNAPDESRVALLVIDMINAFDFEGAKAMLPRALGAARAIAALKPRARKAGVPALSEGDDRFALAHMGGVTKADVRASRELGLEILVNQVGEAQ